jgi:hypothetical protein
MNRLISRSVIVLLLGLALPAAMAAQSADDSISLGDLARQLRRAKAASAPAANTPAAPAAPVIDNDNFAQILAEAGQQKLRKSMMFSFDGMAKDFEISSPDVTCRLSFSGNASALLSNPYAPQQLPENELMKLDGPATVNGDMLEIALHNDTPWILRQVTVGLTLVRAADANSAPYASPRLVPAAAGITDIMVQEEKRSDTTVLLHLRGTAAPYTTTVFRQPLNAAISPDQEWHWAIVDAKGVPPPQTAASAQ